ncbi:MAG: hypothetical protein V3U10_04245 [Bacteroidota bacterium]
MTGSKPRRYVIVVHGIGEQKANETATEVVHRFAEVRQRKPGGYFKNLLPSYLSAQSVRRGGTGHGWSEFAGIPGVDPGKATDEFDGRPATETAGLNFRFVDLRWAHILQRHQERYASSVDKWAKALLDRIDKKKEKLPENWIAPWVSPLLNSLVGTLLPIKRLLSLRYPDLAKRIFDDFLGDVHLYGDYARTRGRAVRHFHVILDEIHLRDFIDWCDHDTGQDNPYQPPEYTIIAHSLGSVLSFDALVYAHAKDKVRESVASADHPCPSLPFPGYTFDREVERDAWIELVGQLAKKLGSPTSEEFNEKVDSWVENKNWKAIEEEVKKNEKYREFKKREHCPQFTVEPPKIPLLLWRKHVKNFITLGSPIDKYHVLWYQNYLHMGLKTKGGDFVEEWWGTNESSGDWLDVPGEIVHYNLCDEQDPVGHHLDVAQRSENYGKIFDKQSMPDRDVVFRRYAVPGVAHVKYWQDGDLFDGIIKEVIDKKETGRFTLKKFRDSESVYRKALTWAYFRIPFAAAMITGLLLSYGYLGWRSSGFRIDYLVAILAALLLWTCPRPTEGYAAEARPEEKEKGFFWERWRFRRSVFAHFLAGAVEWRRILTDKSEGRLRLKKWGFLRKAQWRYLFGLLALGLSFGLLDLDLSTSSAAWSFLGRFMGEQVARFLAAHQKEIHIGAIPLFILSVSYLGTMIYVTYLYLKGRRKPRLT